MKNQGRKERVAKLLMAAGKAHHEAFVETDGVDPDWAVWYGEYLEEPLSKILDSRLSATEITEKVLELDKKFNSESRSEHWTKFYADKLVG